MPPALSSGDWPALHTDLLRAGAYSLADTRQDTVINGPPQTIGHLCLSAQCVAWPPYTKLCNRQVL